MNPKVGQKAHKDFPNADAYFPTSQAKHSVDMETEE
jgi:hypothetical protein